MSDISDIHNRNLGTYAFVGGIAAINQRNQILQQQREQAAALERQHAQLSEQRRKEAASLERQQAQLIATEEKRAAAEVERVQIERKRLELEQLRAKIEAEERALRHDQFEHLKEIRNFMADTIAAFRDLQKQNP